jgi:hypothetical protein
MMELTTERKMYYSLRIAVAMCFLGHGVFGIIIKPIWCNYFAVVGIGKDLAFQLMPPLGMLDVIMGIIILFYPIRAIVLWLVVWGIITALLRPIAGETAGEFVERAGNFGAPLALLLLTGINIRNIRELFAPIRSDFAVSPENLRRAKICLRIVVFLLLAGHGWLNLIEKKTLLDQYASIGFNDPSIVARSIGIFEILAAATVLIKPFAPLILIFFVWKITTEVFYPHYPLFEWIERGGSYGAILALWFAVRSDATLFKSKFPQRVIPAH